MIRHIIISVILITTSCTGHPQRPHEANAKQWAKYAKIDASHISCGGPERNGFQLCTFYVASTVQIFECTRHDVDHPMDGCREPNIK